MTEQQKAAEVHRRLQAIGSVGIHLPAYDLWALLGAAQLAWRHPALGQHLSVRLKEISTRLEAPFAADSLLADLLRMGWEPRLDMPNPDTGPLSVSTDQTYRTSTSGMSDERFSELLHGPLYHPLMPLAITRLVLALRSVVQDTGAAGAAALERYCVYRQEQADRS